MALLGLHPLSTSLPNHWDGMRAGAWMPSWGCGNPKAKGVSRSFALQTWFPADSEPCPSFGIWNANASRYAGRLNTASDAESHHLWKTISFWQSARTAIQAFDNIRRAYDFTNLSRIFKKGKQNLTIFLPVSCAGRILFSPCFAKTPKIFLCLLQSHSSVDFPQICNNFFDVLVAHIFCRAADLIHNATLQTALGIDRFNRLKHTA